MSCSYTVIFTAGSTENGEPPFRRTYEQLARKQAKSQDKRFRRYTRFLHLVNQALRLMLQPLKGSKPVLSGVKPSGFLRIAIF